MKMTNKYKHQTVSISWLSIVYQDFNMFQNIFTLSTDLVTYGCSTTNAYTKPFRSSYIYLANIFVKILIKMSFTL